MEMENVPEAQEFSDLRAMFAKARRSPGYRALRRNIRATKRILPNLLRQATWHYRQLPGAVIVGAQKAGTTQLFSSLIRHPRCFAGAAKELQYFSKRRHLPLSWYQSRFPLASTVERVNGLCLEATPSYLPTPQALRMMRNTIPEVKVVVLLRDPVSRAFSHYQHYKMRQLETRDFCDVVRDAIEQPLYPAELGAAKAEDAEPLLGYVARGYYALQLEVLLEAFPRERVMILDSANLFDNTNRVCQKVLEFLGLEQRDVSPKKIHNRGYYRDVIDPTVAQMLREHYQPHDELLVELLDRSFRWMDEGCDRAAA